MKLHKHDIVKYRNTQVLTFWGSVNTYDCHNIHDKWCTYTNVYGYKFFYTHLELFYLESLLNNMLTPLLCLFSNDWMLTFLITLAEYLGVCSEMGNWILNEKRVTEKRLKQKNTQIISFLAILISYLKSPQDIPV